MRKWCTLFSLILLIAWSAFAGHFGIEANAAMFFPVVQEDQGIGTTFGLKARLALIPGIAFEPNINFAKFGDLKFDFGTRVGSKVNSYGGDACFGSGIGLIGFRLFGLIGAGYYTVARVNYEEVKKLG